MVARVEPPQDGDRVRAAGAVTAGKGRGQIRLVVAGGQWPFVDPQDRAGNEECGPGRFER